jgi:hypothetical protein
VQEAATAASLHPLRTLYQNADLPRHSAVCEVWSDMVWPSSRMESVETKVRADPQMMQSCTRSPAARAMIATKESLGKEVISDEVHPTIDESLPSSKCMGTDSTSTVDLGEEWPSSRMAIVQATTEGPLAPCRFSPRMKVGHFTHHRGSVRKRASADQRMKYDVGL